MPKTTRPGLLVLLMLLGACIPRYGDEWRAPSASGWIGVAGGGAPVEGARVSYPNTSQAVFTAADGTFHIPGVVEKGFSLVMPASGFAWRPLRVEAEGLPTVTVYVRMPLPAHRDVQVEVPPVLLGEPGALPDVDTAMPGDCDDKSWQNAITLWGTARTGARQLDDASRVDAAYEHARIALDAAYYDCKPESPWTGRLKANDLKRALEREMKGRQGAGLQEEPLPHH